MEVRIDFPAQITADLKVVESDMEFLYRARYHNIKYAGGLNLWASQVLEKFQVVGVKRARRWKIHWRGMRIRSEIVEKPVLKHVWKVSDSNSIIFSSDGTASESLVEYLIGDGLNSWHIAIPGYVIQRAFQPLNEQMLAFHKRAIEATKRAPLSIAA